MRCAHKIAMLSLSLLTFSSAPCLWAQATGNLRGSVVDAKGAVLEGASVNVVSQDTGISRITKTDATGQYLVQLLAVGLYTIEVDYSGFRHLVQKNIRLQTDETRQVDFTLSPMGTNIEVEVNAYPVRWIPPIQPWARLSRPTRWQTCRSTVVTSYSLPH